ncbi:MAG: hypothetical protein HYY17_15420 [Planctomycetes bacterium]|nr:hypothetical protein [Planctomycetota bacterium]
MNSTKILRAQDLSHESERLIECARTLEREGRFDLAETLHEQADHLRRVAGAYEAERSRP